MTQNIAGQDNEDQTVNETKSLGPVVNMSEGTGLDVTRERITLGEIVDRFDIVDFDPDGALLVEDRKGTQLADPDLRELGSTGQTQYANFLREDYNPQLRGILGLKKYDEMRRDAQCRASLRLVKTPVLAARWYVEPASESARDRNIAEFVWDNLETQMTSSFPQVLLESLLCLDYGFYVFEKVFGFAPNGKLIWQKLAPRHPLDIKEWEWDKNGGPKAIHFYTDPTSESAVRIPIEKLLVFTFDKEAGNMEGISLLRSAYKHWYFKETLYKIDAIQKERHGIGVPVIKLPPNFTLEDKTLANNMGRNLRTNEKAHIVLPPNWEIMFLKLEGQPVDCIKSIEHHDRMIMQNVLAQFEDSKEGVFVKSTRYIADTIRDTFNRYAIPQLVNYNYARVTRFPQLKARRIGDTTDWRTLSFALRNFVGADLVRADDRLEQWLRDELDLPREDLATTRTTLSPQAPRVELPRQTPAVRSQQGRNAGSTRVGGDNSGGR